MKYLSTTGQAFLTNLAVDDAVLEIADENPHSEEIFRFWESDSLAIVVGRGSKIHEEVNEVVAAQRVVPVYRRSSGGSTVVVGAGCLLYSVLLSYELRPALRSIDNAHRLVMQTLQTALLPLLPGLQANGICDLTWHGKKFSGNALRCKRNFLLYHGTILYNFDVGLISDLLLEPPRQPDYRERRPHSEFVTNIPLSRDELEQAIRNAWQVSGEAIKIDSTRVETLMSERYARHDWHYRR